MRLHTDAHMTTQEVLNILNKAQVTFSDNMDGNALKTLIKRLERTRTLGMWHDHSTLLGKGYVMVTVKVMYDKAVFKMMDEIKCAHFGSIQCYIQQPELHMLGLCSSSVEDQAALIGDRNTCISEFSRGTEIRDELVFFYGDKAAQQVERGTQQGGVYKCGSCGCESHMMDDFAYSMHCTYRSLSDLQAVALAGKYGKQPGVIRPFQTLSTRELQDELRARNVYHMCTTKRSLQKELARVLKGVQRVPTLLLENPEAELNSMQLGRYCILDCEPLHDLKGHLANIFTELPHIITDSQVQQDVKDLLKVVVPKEKPSGGDYRRAMIQLLALLTEKAEKNVVTLVQTIIVEISEILYSNDERRNNVTILRLHNLTWLHYELCKDLFPTLHTLSREKFVG